MSTARNILDRKLKPPAKLYQLDFFVPIAGETKPRDQQDIMSFPCFSLSKRKRTKPIVFKSGENWVEIRGNPKYGMATIWDADVLIYLASYIKHRQSKGYAIPPVLKVSGYDILTFTGRKTGKTDYRLLRAAMRRLHTTNITTNIRQGGLLDHFEFTWISTWRERTKTRIDKKTGKEKKVSLGMEIEVPQWFVDGVLNDKLVLVINPAYFSLKGGFQRWLYRVVRKHCGRQQQWRISMRGLYTRSGSQGPFKEFTRLIKEVVEEKGIPDYHLAILEKGNQKYLHTSPSPILLTGKNVLAVSPP